MNPVALHPWRSCCRLFGIVGNGTKINAGEKEVTAKATAYHEDTADDLESDAIESRTATSTVSLIQVLAVLRRRWAPGMHESVGCLTWNT